ncbi:alkaline phosphatase family protein, partial [Bordetella pertussis]|uniref:alkaline phosphatase family protein n=1 Tax=Bordetella pertussis TaxID=520 RepID=UPI003879251C
RRPAPGALSAGARAAARPAAGPPDAAHLAYHCSMHAGTNPNRLFLWTGTNDPHGQAGGPALVNTHDRPGPAHEGYAWTTYPERLQAAGVDWAIYQDMADNYHDNPLAGFRQYRAELAGGAARAPLRERALSTRTLAAL